MIVILSVTRAPKQNAPINQLVAAQFAKEKKSTTTRKATIEWPFLSHETKNVNMSKACRMVNIYRNNLYETTTKKQNFGTWMRSRESLKLVVSEAEMERVQQFFE